MALSASKFNGSDGNMSLRSSDSDEHSFAANPFGSFRQQGDFPSAVFGYSVSFSSDTSSCSNYNMNNSTHIYINLLNSDTDLNTTLGPRQPGDGQESTPANEDYLSETQEYCQAHDSLNKVQTWLDGQHHTKPIGMSSPTVLKLKRNLKKVGKALHAGGCKTSALTTLAIL